MMFMQLPAALPMIGEDDQAIKVGDLPSGYIGKMLVYRSGKVQMKIGDILFDVSIGTPSSCLQQVACISPEDRKAYILGTIKERTIVTPNIEHLLSQESADNKDSL
jgi:DNA-directed RNA polymerase III subunit RPC4